MELTLSDLNSEAGSPAALAAAAVMERLDECRDFERFGTMMRRRYDEIYGDDDDTSDVVEPEPQQVATAGLDDFQREQQQIQQDALRRRQRREEAMRRAAGLPKAWTHVRVLWDMESIPMPPHLSGSADGIVHLVSSLRSCVASHLRCTTEGSSIAAITVTAFTAASTPSVSAHDTC